MADFFTSEINGSILTVTLTKPKQHNVLNPNEMEALRDFFASIDGHETVRVAILTGEGKSFCAGANLDGIKDYDFARNPLEQLTGQIEAMSFPVICKLNGGVYGGGTDLALACDFRLGMPEMKCFIPPAKLGIHYPPLGLQRAVSRIGLGPAKRLFLALETMKGDDLKSIGFLDYLVEADQLDQKAQELAETIAGLAPISLRGMKATLNSIAVGALDLDAAREAQMACLNSEDFLEGKAAVQEKRPPVFKGK